MTRLRKLFGERPPDPQHERFVDYVLHEWDEILSTYAALGIQVDAELPQEDAADDEPDEHDIAP